MSTQASCELCTQAGGEIVCRQDAFRVVLVDDPNYPGFCRVIWNAHVREMTDLSPADREQLMQAVWKVEAAIRTVMAPAKMNIASFGNMVPHLHWHLIPRFEDDAHFPSPIWAQVQRTGAPDGLAERQALLPTLKSALVRQFS
ncbi:MAG TPA: HIT family protein [Noviherbaspirillum sp.]|jgi:diadenosine tetraphosphate (Ap4A) HIT family hydrolase|uniref:HIT family protein n=1 Tax=Noviherbaspirillum sp. TaxID=1926288 RepID=UPI002DDD6BD0|nr:HIT family protein [Noviherbaspirillum sp.]HEV2611578.1 HIT family protein [Noviherbaspirillum sp.]